MATVNNPYSDLLNIMASQGAVNNPPGIKLGTVKSIDPLIIAVEGVELDDNFVKVSETLRPHKRKCKLKGRFEIELETPYTPKLSNASCECGTHTHTSSTLFKVVGGEEDGDTAKFKGEIEFTEWLIKEDDIVLVLSSNDKQSYVVIAKL